MRAVSLPRAFLVSEPGIQSRLLSDHFFNAGVCRCRVVGRDRLAEWLKKEMPALVLIDVAGEQALQPMLVEGSDAVNAGVPLALMNVAWDADIYPYLQYKGVVGAFREDAEPELLVRGVHAMLAGEFWFPRDALNRYLEEGRAAAGTGAAGALDRLTRRELTVLRELSEGSSNDAIAERLCVSTYTVKTHLYNIYRKLDVSNRVEAVIEARHQLGFGDSSNDPRQ